MDDIRLITHIWEKTFYISRNNGLSVIMDDRTYNILGKSLENAKAFLKTATPNQKTSLPFIFVFGGRDKGDSTYRYCKDKWLIGTDRNFRDFISLLEAYDCEIIDLGSNMYVPFSNGQVPLPEECHLIQRESDFEDIVGIPVKEITQALRAVETKGTGVDAK